LQWNDDILDFDKSACFLVAEVGKYCTVGEKAAIV
jgi:hypothetical protein